MTFYNGKKERQQKTNQQVYLVPIFLILKYVWSLGDSQSSIYCTKKRTQIQTLQNFFVPNQLQSMLPFNWLRESRSKM